jgi:antitoxin (DNA-binding transcriptional repressor) of toxin-antitoxin stability system
MADVGVRELKQRLFEYLDRAERGGRVKSSVRVLDVLAEDRGD